MKIIKKVSKTLDVQEVELRGPIVDDLLKAERIAGKAEGLEFMLALLSQVGTFDGQALPPEELRRLSSKDFLDLSKNLDLSGTVTSPDTSSTSSEKEDSETAVS